MKTNWEMYLSSIPDEEESRGEELVLYWGPRRECMEEEFDVGCVVLVHDRPRHNRGVFIEDDILDESCDCLSACTPSKGQTGYFEGVQGLSALLTRWREWHSRACWSHSRYSYPSTRG